MNQVNKTFKYVWTSRLISILGTGLTEFGVSVWVFAMTGKATPMAITMLCGLLPSILFAPFSGIVCDRINRKKLIIIADTAAVVTTLLLLLYIIMGEFHIGVICFFTFLSATANMFDNNAYQASISTLVSKDELKTANGMNQLIDSLSSIAAPVLAGILYYAIGLKGIIFIDLASYLISLLLLTRVPRSHFSNQETGKVRDKGMFHGIGAGFEFIFHQKGLTLLMLFHACLNFVINLSGALIEPLSLSLGNSVHLGIIKMCGGVGMLCGSLYITVKKLKISYSKGIFLASVWSGFALMMMGVRDSVVTIAIGRLLFLFALPISNTMTGTLWISKTPKELQGRVYAARMMVVRCIMPLSFLLVGPLADRWIPGFLGSSADSAKTLLRLLGENSLNFRIVFVIGGMFVLLCTLIFFSSKNLRRIDE